MSNKLQFELTSPQKTAFNKPVAMVTVPASQGAYSVLIGHAPMVTDVAPGVVEIYENGEDKVSERVFVTGGYCEVTTTRCSLMADDILDMATFKRAEIEDAIEALIKTRGELGPEDSDAEIEASLAIEQAKLLVV
jgi:F-type H+-transporting ATPase subunit epsilon